MRRRDNEIRFDFIRPLKDGNMEMQESEAGCLNRAGAIIARSILER